MDIKFLYQLSLTKGDSLQIELLEDKENGDRWYENPIRILKLYKRIFR